MKIVKRSLSFLVLVAAASVVATASARTEHYTVTVVVTGPGHVTLPQPDPTSGSIDCPTQCSALIKQNSTVTLTATPDSGATFAGWGGDCASAGTSLTCTISLTGQGHNGSESISAGFDNPPPPPPMVTLAVKKTGTGTGFAGGGGIDCGKRCSVSVAEGTKATLLAVADPGSTLLGWSGVCSGALTCKLTVKKNLTATVTFVDQRRPYVVALPGKGRPGGVVNLQFRVWDNRGASREELTVAHGAATLDRVEVPLGAVVYRRLRSVTWRIPATAAPAADQVLRGRDRQGRQAQPEVLRGPDDHVRRGALIACALGAIFAGVASPGKGAQATVLGIIQSDGVARLVQLNPSTLRRVGLRSVALWRGAAPFDAWSRSPDGSRVALAVPEGVRFVGVRTLSASRVIPLGPVYSVDWISTNAVLVELTDAEVSIDPATLHVRWRRSLPDSLQDVEPTPSGLVFLASPTGGYGPTTLTTLDTTGRMRTVLLPQIHSGYEDGTQNPGADPGVTVDPASDTAYVVGGGDPVAAVNLRTLAVSYHAWPRAPTNLDYGVNGPTRAALWLGNGLIAVTGVDQTDATDGSVSQTSIGLSIVDTSTWTSHLIDPGASSASEVDGLVLAYGETEMAVGVFGGDGFAGYRPDGTRLFKLFGSDPVTDVQVVGSTAYVQAKGTRIVDLASGRLVRTVSVPTLLELLVEPPR